MTFRTKGLLGRLAGLFVLSGALISAGPVFGQSATDQSTTAQTGEAAGTLQEVEITAERRTENVQSTPISVVAISGADLQAESVATINNLTTVAPDVSIESGGGTSAIQIRGIGQEPVGLDEAGVVVVRDGVINAQAGIGTDMPFYDMADVEILRGPQGTIQGDNSTGGAVIINSQNPNFRGINGYANAKVATYSDTELQGAVNLPVTDTLAMRFAFNEEVRGGFNYDEGAALAGPNETGPYLGLSSTPCPNLNRTCDSSPISNNTSLDPGNLDAKDFRFGILWKPTDNFQSLTKIEIDHNDTDGLPTQPNTNTFAPLGAGLPCPAGHGTAPNCVELYYSGYSGNPRILNSWLLGEKYDEDVDTYSEELRYTLPTGTVARVIGYDQNIVTNQATNATFDSVDIQDGRPDINYQRNPDDGVELDLLSPTTGKFSWIAGGVFTLTYDEPGTYTTTTTPPYSPANPEVTMWVDGERIMYKQWGTFGQITYQLTPTLQFQGGVRLGWDDETAWGSEEVYRAPLSTEEILSTGHDFNDQAFPTGKAGFNWTPVTGQFFYGFWSRGYKPGLGNVGDGKLKGEHVDDYELGWKGTLAGGHVQTDVGGYYMRYTGLIEQTFNPSNAISSGDSNFAPSSVKGIEASMQSKFGHLGFNIGADYNRSTIGSGTTAATYAFPAGYGVTNQCTPAQIAAGAPLTVCTNYTPFLITLSGESLPFSPLFQGSATLEYDIPLGNMYLEPRVVYSYTDKEYGNLIQVPFFELPAHGLMNTYLDFIDGPLTVTVFATNVTNKLYLTNIAATSEYYGDPRQIGLQVNRTF